MGHVIFRTFSALTLNSNVSILRNFYSTTPIFCSMSKNVLLLDL